VIALLEGIRIALAAIWEQKLRSALTLSCVVIAILSIIAVVSVLDGMDQYVREKIVQAGTNTFELRRVDELKIATDFGAFLRSLKNPKLVLTDFRALKRELVNAECVEPLKTVNVSLEAVSGGRSIKNVEVQGRGGEYPTVEDLKLASGVHVSQGDVDERRDVIVLGEETASTLFPDVQPVGQRVRIEGRHYEVIGVFDHRDDVLGMNRNVFAVVPITAMFAQFGAFGSVRIEVKAKSLDQVDAAIDEARTVMRVRHGLRPDQEDDFNVQTAEEFLSFWDKISSGIFASLIGVVSITLVVGGIIIMNVMLVSVTERTREIGVRKALGARRGVILFQFLVESVTLTSTGGIVGIALGFVVAFLVAAFSPLPYAVKPWSIVAALAIVFAVGIFFGLYPASRAARLQPVEALRREGLRE
jgi:putative ABC transport system permease protein